jgi:WD40 repeat protein
VFVLSPDSVSSDVTTREVAYAASLNKRLAPIVYRRVEDRAVPEALRRLNFIFFDDPARFESNVGQLAAALQTDIGWIRQHTEYGEAARHWAASNRPSGLLLRSPALEQAERWIASRPREAPEPTQETQAFVTESRRNASRRRNILTASLAAGLLVALGLAGFAYRQSVIAGQQQHFAEQQQQLAEQQRQFAEQQRQLAEQQRQQVVTREMNRRASLSQQLGSAGRTQVATALALDAVGSGSKDKGPTPELQAAIHRAVDLMKVPIERYIGDNVINLALSPDGRTLAAGTVKGTVHILDGSTLNPRFEFKTGADVVSGLDFSPDSKRLVVSGDKIPNVWNVETGTKLFDLQRRDARQPAYHAQFSPDGKLIVVATGENRALIHSAETGQPLHDLPGASYDEMRNRLKTQSGAADPIVEVVNRSLFQMWGAATDAIFSPDGTTVAVTGPSNPDASVRLFNAATGHLVRTLTGGRGANMLPPLNYGNTFAFSPDGSSIIAAPVGITIKIWNAKSGQLRTEFPVRGISSFVLTADGAAVVSAHDNGSLIFRCLTQNSAVVSLSAHDRGIDSLSVDRTGRLLATGSADHTARVWSMPKGSDVCGFDKPGKQFDTLSALRPMAILSGHGARIAKAVFSIDGRTLTTASQDGWVRNWPLGPNSDSTSIPLPETDRVFDGWRDLMPSWNGRTIFAYNSDHYSWHGWDSASGRPIDLPGDVQAVAPGSDDIGPILFRSPVSYVALDGLGPNSDTREPSFSSWHGPVSADGSRVVADEAQLKDKTGNGDVPVLAKSDTREVLAPLVVDGRTAKDLFFSPDGSRLFGRLDKPQNLDGNRDGIAAWDAKSGNLIGVIPSIPNYLQSSSKSVSHDGTRLLLVPSEDELALFDVTENELRPVDVPDTGEDPFGIEPSVSAVSADGTYLLRGRRDGVIRVIDIKKNALWRVFDAGGIAINAVTMSRDRRYIAATDDSNTLWIFNAEIGELVRSTTFPEEIVSMMFLSESDRLAVLDRRNLTIVPMEASFAGRSDTASIVDSARKLGFNLVSEENRQRYKLGTASGPQQPAHQWAALHPNSEGTTPVVWADTEEQARSLAAEACQRLSTTCSSTAAVTEDLASTFVFFCCTNPRLGCAVVSGAGDRALLSVKAILAKAKYSSCEVRAALSARDGSAR